MTDPSEFQALSASIGADLSIDGARRLLGYLDAMLDENTRINLTAVRERDAAVRLHALDSVALACLEPEGGPARPPGLALDLGTGNGFPGVAIACLYPDVRVVLMDRRLKKLHAIQRALAAAGFEPEQFEIAHMDAAAARNEGYRARFDLITTRAVGPPEAVGKLAKPLLAPGGRFVAWMSDETEALAKLKCGLELAGSAEYALPAPADRTRRIASYRLQER
ncbi:Ribosomal RNA small subunit methyltransferase G [Planctomycetes bacterium Poly30]|uniref:Ribosomal RNA small subunit methyltransferase G n=1 Tax=Saltatorellus ferox TaxID=2528018 RepID=A0A518EVA8_9BACT|nr:Ribosomal RNA small subunit methyltransferase G [Planctomycetes bacterium Poly30]